MTRKLIVLWLAVLALPLFVTPGAAQNETREVELRLMALSRGYMRPMGATTDRLARLPGIEAVEALGGGGDAMRFKLTTSLSDQALAEALQLKLQSAGAGVVTLAAVDDDRARRAEARGVLMQIALAVMAQPKPSWRRDSTPLFEGALNLKQKLERLGLKPALLQGNFYKPDDYHVEESWQGSGGEYRIWAGDEWQGLFVRSDDWYYVDEGEAGQSKPAMQDPRFVGIRVYRSPWNSSLSWVDLEGLQLTGFGVSRDETDAAGELYLKQGADWLHNILRGLCALRVREPDRKMDRLPQGRGWVIISELGGEDEEDEFALQRWDLSQFNIQDFQLAWRDEDGRLIANLKVHHPAHPLYLEAEVDTNMVVDNCKKTMSKAEMKKAKRVDPGDALTWIVAAEESVEVFKRRRADAEANFQRIREALKKAAAIHTLDELCGSLDDAELIGRLGIELPKDAAFAPSEYRIRRQMLGDVEISVGTARTGGRYWMLANAAGGEVIRSSR
jgi:hypothetical protein